MSQISNLYSGDAVFLEKSNVDTDQIIPKQYLKSIKKTGLGPFLFDAWRFEDEGYLGKKLNERIINKEFILNKSDPLLFFIQRLRDEAHRFAISTHRAKRKKNLSKSLLDQIQGIGKQRKRALLNHFGSARAVESASLEDLKAIEGIEDSIANKIYNYFHE